KQTAERMSDHKRLRFQLSDDVGGVVGHLGNRLVREDLRVGFRLLDGGRVVRPSRRQGRIARLFEDGGPAVPAAWEQPEAVDKYHGCAPARVRPSDLVGGNARYRVDHRLPPLFVELACLLDHGTPAYCALAGLYSITTMPKLNL